MLNWSHTRPGALLGMIGSLVVVDCHERLIFYHHNHGAGAGGIGGASSSSAGGAAGSNARASGGTHSDASGEAGEEAVTAGASDGGSSDEATACSIAYRCQANVLQHCTGGAWSFVAQCNLPDGVCNARAGACLAVAASGSFVSLGAAPAGDGPHVIDSQLSLVSTTCNSSKTACVRGGFLP